MLSFDLFSYSVSFHQLVKEIRQYTMSGKHLSKLKPVIGILCIVYLAFFGIMSIMKYFEDVRFVRKPVPNEFDGLESKRNGIQPTEG